MTSSLPPPARARLTRELSLLHSDPPPGCAAYVPDESDVSNVRVQITGPPDTPYDGSVFLIAVRITSRYPFEPPRVRFLTPVYHPNVDSAGRICLDTLKRPPAGSWSPAVSLPSLLLSLRALLASPNPDDGLVPEISELYKRDPDKWRDEARKRARRDATAERLAEMESRIDGGGGAAAGSADGEEEDGDEGGGGGGGGAAVAGRAAPNETVGLSRTSSRRREEDKGRKADDPKKRRKA